MSVETRPRDRRRARLRPRPRPRPRARLGDGPEVRTSTSATTSSSTSTPSRCSRATRAAWSTPQRRALVTLLKQRFISARTHPRDWRVLVEHERLAPVAAQRPVPRAAGRPRPRGRVEARRRPPRRGSRFPTMLYDAAWSREETLVLVHLRDRLRAGAAGGETRVFVDREDVVRVRRRASGPRTPPTSQATRSGRGTRSRASSRPAC